MIAATLFSGIGAPETAMPSWDWRWSAEIEAFPSAVLAVRHPQSVNLGDVTADDFLERAEACGRPDVLVFGSPCQSFSVAGRRLGLDDPRGNLALVALGLVDRLRPRWFCFENVPGLFSNWSGGPEGLGDVEDGLRDADAYSREFLESSDFAEFVSRVQELRYCGCWTVLDAQFAGLAQRRDRVFFVGHLGTAWQYPAAVLLEPESLCGHPPTRGEARERPTGTLAARTAAGGGLGTDFDLDGGLVAGTIGHHHGNVRADQAWTGQLVPEVSPAMKARDFKGASSDGDGDGLPLVTVTHSLRADGFDASEDGTGRGTPLVPTVAPCLTGNYGKQPDNSDTSAGPMLVAVADPNQVTSKANRSQPTPELSHTLPAKGNSPIAYAIGSHAGAADGEAANKSHAAGGPVGLNISEEQAYALRGGRTQAVAFGFANTAGETRQGFEQEQASPITTRHGNPGNVFSVALRGREGGGTAELGGDTATALRASQGGGDKPHVLTSGVRRLTPRECERLQGFPDDYTLVSYRGKPAADGPRYKAIGNSMAVPVIRWILERIEAVEQIKREAVA